MSSNSKTKNHLDEETIQKLVKQHFTQSTTLITPLTDGFYNASYLIKLESEKEVVLKVAPPPQVTILEYEKDIMATEVLFYQLTEAKTDVPIPHVIAFEPKSQVIDSGYYFMTKLEGKPLNRVAELTPERRRPVYEVLARNLAKLHSIEGECFGYTTMKAQCEGFGAHRAIMNSFRALMSDCEKVSETLPISHNEIWELLHQTKKAFDEVIKPCLVHFDLWDGNIFVLDQEPLVTTGYIDFERGFYGDPAADFCQVQGYMNLKENSWFIDIYNQYAKTPVVLDQSMEIRMTTYRLYLFVIMYVESFYRDVDGSFDGQKQWVSRELPLIMAHLKQLIDGFN